GPRVLALGPPHHVDEALPEPRGEHRGGAREDDERERADHRGHQRPFQVGRRFSRKAVMPSRASSVANRPLKARCSAASPSASEPASPSLTARLVAATASGALPASMSAYSATPAAKSPSTTDDT